MADGKWRAGTPSNLFSLSLGYWLRVPRTLKMRRGVYSLRAINRCNASTPPFSSVWQIAVGVVSAFKTPHTSLPRPPFGGVRLKQHSPTEHAPPARRALQREAAGGIGQTFAVEKLARLTYVN